MSFRLFLSLSMVLLLMFLSLGCASSKPLKNTIIIIDPGHGDSSGTSKTVLGDSGAEADSPHGRAYECVFTWDTSMRLKKCAESQGAKVFLTLKDPDGNYEPQAWGPQELPTVPNGEKKKNKLFFKHKNLIDIPNPTTDLEALDSRVATANRIYRENKGAQNVYFISLHFDVAKKPYYGITLYYPATGKDRSFCNALASEIKEAHRERKDFSPEKKIKCPLTKASNYRVLTHSVISNTVLIELGNIWTEKPTDRNPDLWRMRNPINRQLYAELILCAINKHIVLKKTAKSIKSTKSKKKGGG